MKLEITAIDAVNGTYKDNTVEIREARKKRCRKHYIINTFLIISILIPTCLLIWAFVLAPMLN